MLNLVQIQDKLKNLPTQAVMAYANGQNPMVPPYLALGELNRRKGMEQAVMAEQAKEEPPTVKEATEQQLGLMNLQKQRAMQAQQGMGRAMANSPSPVPAGVGEEPVQMARGGIARIPVRNFRRDSYAGGGIVAFQAGGLTAEQELMKKIIERAGKEQTMEEMIAEQKAAREAAGVRENPYEESQAAREGLMALRQEREGRQPMRELREYLLGMSKTKPGYGLGLAFGSGEEQRGKEVERFESEVDKQKIQEMQWMRADEKERDAIARGDADAALKAKRDKERLQYDVAKLSTDRKTQAYGRAETLFNQNPEVRSALKRQQDLSPSDPEYQELENRIEEIRQSIYKSLDLDVGRIPPRTPRAAPPAKEKKQNPVSEWWKKNMPEILGGDSEEKPAGPQLPAGLPAGTTYAGKDKATGKDVYRTPDGKLLTAK